MLYNINIEKGKEDKYMTRTATWNNLGSNVRGSRTIEEVLQRSGLDYTVNKGPISYSANIGGNEIQFPIKDKEVTYRIETGANLGIVGTNYKVVQNRDAFDFVNSIDADMEFIKAGQARNGAVWIIAQFPEMNVLGDNIRPHFIFQNGHNGVVSLKATICMLRLVCQNQFNAAFKGASNYINLRHCGDMDAKLEMAKETVNTMVKYLKAYKGTAEEMANKRINNTTLQTILSKMIADEKEVEPDSLAAERLNYFHQAYNSDDNANFKGTAWGVMNAYTDFLTHMPNGRKTNSLDDTRFIQVSLENRAMNKMMTLLNQVV